ncbi:MAG TPA: hypothetical protein VGX78_05570, partial [Pirellulales bacterium]|nr:hypothetical protein [Pirellulales bacterium]
MNLGMSLAEVVARSFGLDPDERITAAQWSFAAEWAHGDAGRLAAGCLALAAAGWLLYARFQPRRRPAARVFLSACRSLLLCLPLVILAEPVLRLTIAGDERPLVWLLFDGSRSMAMEDPLPKDETARLAAALEFESPPGAKDAGESGGALRVARVDWLRALLKKRSDNLPRLLERRFRLEAFAFSRADGVDRLPLAPDGAAGNLDELASALTTHGQVTALGAALADLARRPGANRLAGVVVFSDFDENSGTNAVGAARRLGAPVYTVGVGPETAVDLSVALETRTLMKATERETPRVVLHQTGLDGRSVDVRLTARRLGRSDVGRNLQDGNLQDGNLQDRNLQGQD